MLGWVITCHDDRAQELQDRLEEKHGPLAQCRAVNFWRGLSTNMLSRMMCEALHQGGFRRWGDLFNGHIRRRALSCGVADEP